jgi:hypothetical protein
MFGRYIDKFDVTDKAVVVEDRDNNTKVVMPQDHKPE